MVQFVFDYVSTYRYGISLQNLKYAFKVLQQYHIKFAYYLVGLVKSVGSGSGRTP
jgi:hypothetical protein